MDCSRIPYLAVDVETTGFRVGQDSIYEVALVAFNESGTELWHYESLCRPRTAQLSKRLSVLADAPAFVDIANDVVTLLARADVIIGHNVTFDLEMLDQELQAIGSAIPEMRFIDSMEEALRLRLDIPDRQLSTMCHVFGVNASNFHTAVVDATASGHLIFALRHHGWNNNGLSDLPNPSTFSGSGSGSPWPVFKASAPPFIRDPTLLPPATRTSDPDLYTAHTDRIELKLDFRLAEAAASPWTRRLALLEVSRLDSVPLEIADWVSVLEAHQDNNEDHAVDEPAVYHAANKVLQFLEDPSGRLAAARDDLAAGGFEGSLGIARLECIIEIFNEFSESGRYEVSLLLARLKRFEPSFSPDDVSVAYEAAFNLARICEQEEHDSWVDSVEGDDDDSDDYAPEVLSEWFDYLRAVKAFEEALALVVRFDSSRFNLKDQSWANYIRWAAKAGEPELACQLAEQIYAFLSDHNFGDRSNVVREWAQALEALGRRSDAVAVCQQATDQGLSSSALVAEHVGLLAKEHRWVDAVAVLDAWEAGGGDPEPFTKRRARFMKHLGEA